MSMLNIVTVPKLQVNICKKRKKKLKKFPVGQRPRFQSPQIVSFALLLALLHVLITMTSDCLCMPINANAFHNLCC